MKIIEEQAREVLYPLLEDGLFVIQPRTVFYNNVVFGNSLILLKAKNDIIVKFTDDRRYFSCDIGVSIYKFEFDFSIETVFKYLKLSLPDKPDDFLEMIKIYSISIRENKDRIFEAFDEKHRDETEKNIRQQIS